jgi:hypothetical protein
LIPKGRYKGQKLIKLVKTNTAERTNNTIANVPEMTFPKNNPKTTNAIITRIARSMVPIFFFIITDF